MKTKSLRKLSLISSLAVAGLIGTGFAAWQFAGGAGPTDQISQVSITGVSGNSNGTIEFATDTYNPTWSGSLKLYIVLDQGGNPFFSTAGYSNDTTKTYNEMLSTKVTAIDYKYVVAEGASGDTSNVKMTWKFAADDAFDTYISGFTAYENEESLTKGVTQGKFTLPELAWTAKKPTTKSAYTTMSNNLKDAVVTLTISAEVVE
jgi:hypothetical protein